MKVKVVVCLFRRPIRFEIGFIFVLLKARSFIRTTTQSIGVYFNWPTDQLNESATDRLIE